MHGDCTINCNRINGTFKMGDTNNTATYDTRFAILTSQSESCDGVGGMSTRFIPQFILIQTQPYVRANGISRMTLAITPCYNVFRLLHDSSDHSSNNRLLATQYQWHSRWLAIHAYANIIQYRLAVPGPQLRSILYAQCREIGQISWEHCNTSKSIINDNIR